MNASGPPPFDVTVRDEGEHVLVMVRGELDLAVADRLEGTLIPLVQGGRHAVLDLRELDFMDSTGVRVMLSAHLAAQEHGGRLSVLRTAEGTAVRRVLEISGLDGVLNLVDAP